MADKLLDLEGLTYYDQKIKNYIDTADETVTSDLEQQLQTETQARTQADTQLQTNIDSEASARESADEQLQTNITNEETARQNADTALGSRIDDIEDGTTSVGKLTNPLQFGVEGSLDNYNGSVAGKKITKTILGLGNVDNTADINKPVSTPQQNAINNAKSELLGDAGTNYNTLGKLEDAIQAEVTRAGQAEDAIDGDLQSFKTSTNQNITQIEEDLASEGERITALDNNAVKKTGQTNQAIQGNISIQGDLTVSGTTTSEDHQTLMVQDNIIVTNSDGVAISGLSGMAIRINSTSAFGIVYDPSVQELKAGLGTLSAENEFTFSSGEGFPITLRDSDGDLVNGNVVMWDNVGKRLTDSGIVANLIALQNGTYENMSVGKATSDASGNNIESTYATKSELSAIPSIPTPTTGDNGKILSVQNGVYTLVNQDTGYYYVILTGISLPIGGASTSATITSEQSELIQNENCIGIYLQDTVEAGQYTYFPKLLDGYNSAILFSIILPDILDSGALESIFIAVADTSVTISSKKINIYENIATSSKRGLVQPVTKTSAMAQQVGIDSDGKLYTEQGNYFVELAGLLLSETTISGTITTEQYQSIQNEKCIGVYATIDSQPVYFNRSTESETGIFFTYTQIMQTDSNPLFSLNSIILTITSGGIVGNVFSNSIPYGYATPDVRGYVQPVAKTDAMTQQVGVDGVGALWTTPPQVVYATDEEINALFS